jgi:hypothetical protein
MEWINILDLVKDIKKKGKHIPYFDADLVNSEGLFFRLTEISVILTKLKW